MTSLRPQRGSLMVMFALMLLVLLGCIGMALDLGQVYARKTELQQLADAAALAAANALDGTAAGVTAARARAQEVAAGYRYGYTLPVAWSDDALRLAADPDAPEGDWQTPAAAGASNAAAAGLLFARVDTRQLDAAHGQVEFNFLRALSANLAGTSVAARAVAGRGGLRLTPLGVCALSKTATAPRTHSAAAVELIEHGFRRGVSYNLLRLNPNGAGGLYFLLDPLDAPGQPGNAANTTPARLAPFFCSGSMALTRIGASAIAAVPLTAAAGPFALADQLNARFDQNLGAACRVGGAPPDANVKAYTAAAAALWMTPAPSGTVAEERANPNPDGAGTSLSTLAERLPAAMAAGDTAAGYGPLWSYNAAVRYAANVAPGGAYTAFSRTDWSTLYPVYGSGAKPAASTTLLANGMYSASGGSWLQAPGNSPSLRQRRLLNIPLLDCAAGAGSMMTVLGIGRFFMTTPASGTAIGAEFAGLASEQALGNRVELYQ